MAMEIFRPTLKLITKRDFVSARSNYKEICPEADRVITNAKDFDVLGLTVKLGSALCVLDAKIISENEQEAFLTLLQSGGTK